MKLNELGRWKFERLAEGEACKLYSDLLRARKRELAIAVGFQQGLGALTSVTTVCLIAG